MTLSGSIEMAEKVDMNPYLSGGLCRMTKQAAACRWSTHGSQSDNRNDHLLAVLPCIAPPLAFLHCVHCSQDICVLCSVRHSPQFMGVFHSFVLGCLNMCTVLTAPHCTDFVAEYGLASTLCLLLICCIAALVLYRCSVAVVLSRCIGTFPLQWYLSRCSALVLTAPHCRLNLSDARSGNTQHCTSSSTFIICTFLFVTRSAAPASAYDWTYDRLQPAVHIFNHLSCCLPVNNIECKNAIHRSKRTIIGGSLRIFKSI